MEFKQSLSREVFERKYCLHGEKSPEEVFLRVSKEIASVEKEDVREYWEKVFYDAIASGTFIPAGRQLANAGPDSLMKNYNNCFTIDLWDSMTGIFVPLSEDAYISQVGGGVGFNASKLRPRFATISKGGYSTGVMSFLVIFDASAKSIHTGGGRRSAHIAVLDVWHPDILEFINFKKGRENDALTQFNISVGITDEFMRAVKNDEDWQLVFPLMKHEKEEEHETVWKKNPFDEEYAISEGYKLDGNGNVLMKVYNTIKATELYDEMAKQAWWYNEPGALFLDTIEKDNNAPHKFKIDRCNPCVSGDTLVAVADGRGSVSFEQLVKEGKDVPVFCKDGDGRTVIRTMRNPRITGYDKDIYKITLDDGSVIKCNDSHKLFTKNEEYERADTLSVGDYVWVNTKDETTHYKIASIEIIGKENVYNGTVDEFHNYNTVVLNTETKSGKGKMVMVNNKNCGEITMGSYELCCLSSINLSTLVRNPFTDNSSFDFDEFRKYVGIGIRFLDNVISATDYPIEKIKVNALNRRRLGLGITGLGDALIKLGIRYGSKESIEFMDKLGNQMANTAYLTSSNLAEEKGSFPEFDEEIGKHGFIPKLDEDVQESIRVKGLRNIGLLTTAPTGCLVPDSMVHTNEGLLTLEELIPNYKDYQDGEWIPQSSLEAVNEHNDFKTVKNTFVNGFKPTKKLQTSSGVDIEGTPNHKFRIYDANAEEKYSWRKLEDISVGDKIIYKIGGYDKKENKKLLIPDYTAHGNENEITLPEEMTPDFAYFLGAYNADGSTHKKGIRISLNHLKGEATHISKIVKDIFGWDVSISNNGRNCDTVYISSQRLLRFLEENDLIKNRTLEIEIPKAVRQSSKESVLAYIDGYFFGDGSAFGSTKYIDTFSKKNAQQLATVMRAVGINSRIAVYDKSLDEASFSDNLEYRVYFKKFGSVGEEKTSRFIKTEIREDVEALKEFGDGLFIDEVISVEDSENFTLDIEVPEGRTYIANSYVSHNTTSLTLGNNCSSGIEPIFSLQYERTVRQDDGSDKKDIVYDYGWLEYLEFAKENGIEVDVNNLPDWLVTSHQIPIKEGIDVQSAFQKWIDHSISKCVAKGTLISTNKGIIPIEKLSDTKYEKEDSFGELNDEYYVFDEYGNKQKVISHYFNGVKDGIEITFSNGSKITGSNEHKLKTDNGWKKLSEIKEGDYVLYRKNCNLNDVNILNEIPQPNFYNNIERKFPKFMTKEFAKFLGMFVADGFTTKNGFGIVEKDEYVKKEVEKLFNILFGGSKISVDKRSGVRSHLINSRAIAGLFDTWIGKGCVNKKVPDEIMKSNHEVQIAFLEGVTLDGYIAQSNTLVLYEGYSEKLTEQISIMCQDLGIRNYIGTKKVKNGRLSNVSYSVRIFPESKIINPIEEHKKNYSCNFRKKEMLLVEGGDREYYLNNLPSTKNKDYFSFRNLKRALKNSNFVSRGLLEKSCGVDKLDKELLGIKVVNAKEVKDVELYDIEVENTHSYLINGIISHNTVNMPFETTLDEYKDIFMYAWENNLKGVTSFHEGASMDGILTTTKTTEKEELWKTIEVLKNSTRRPEELPCDIYEIQVNKEPVIVLVGRNPEAPYNNAPYEIFYTDNSDGLFNMGRAKEGKIVKIKDGKNKPSRYDLVVESKRSRLVLEDLAQAFNDDYATICRYISLALRHQIPVEFVHDQANKVKRFGTFQKAIARVLKNYIPDGEAISAEKHVCPECEGQMVFEGGCVICKNCGFSACG